MPTETTQEAAKPTQPEAKKKPAPKAGPKKPATKAAAKPAKARKPRATKSKPAKTARPRKAAAKPAPKPKARRRQSTPVERQEILATAERKGLTALEVQKRFGVKPVTYYSWRKASRKRGGMKAKPAVRSSLAGLDIANEVRRAIRAHVARLLPEIIRSEVAVALGGVEAGTR